MPNLQVSFGPLRLAKQVKNKSDTFLSAKKARDPKLYGGLQILFFGSTRSLRMHISRTSDHYDVYLDYCTKNGIKPHSSAFPSDTLFRKDAILKDKE